MKADVAHTIGVLECSNDVVLSSWPNLAPEIAVFNVDRKGWLDRKILDASSGCAENSEIKTEW